MVLLRYFTRSACDRTKKNRPQLVPKRPLSIPERCPDESSRWKLHRLTLHRDWNHEPNQGR
jgi:hypothetical protein